jgi:hypothetical protein
MLGHESAFGAFPAGRKTGPSDAAESGFVAILPRIEEQPLFDTLKLTGTLGLWNANGYWGPDAATQSRVREAVRQRPPIFVCPADSSSQPLNAASVVVSAAQWEAPRVSATSAATASYAMCNGRTPWNLFGSNERLVYVNDDNHEAVHCGMFDQTGAPRNKEDVRDGLSKTFMLGETIDTHTPSGINLWSASRAGHLLGNTATVAQVGGGNLDSDNTMLRCCLCAPNSRVNKQDCGRMSTQGFNPRYVISTSGSTGKYKGFDSLHPGGVVMAYADGRTQFIDEQIDLVVYKGLSTVYGRERIDAP